MERRRKLALHLRHLSVGLISNDGMPALRLTIQAGSKVAIGGLAEKIMQSLRTIWSGRHTFP
ncbi:hypothetical protein [Pedobacter hiemivivus]|uniref:hypothetical protein n=1 Tax=Pedobacter hiemivivus TaxID=2530454 RepID=UPI00197DBED9|nr:hypothetical protein [Pedobacter hiemivivus]